MMGANVFLGLRFAVWDDADPEQIADDRQRHAARGVRPVSRDVTSAARFEDRDFFVRDGLKLHYRDYPGRQASRRCCAFTG